MTALILDIETLPGQTEAAREQARADTRPPGTLRKAESVAAWWETEGPDAIEATWRKQALDPAQGELAALAFASLDSTPQSVVRALDEPEAVFLRRAIAAVDALQAAEAPALQADGTPWPFADGAYLVGHNLEGFDLPFLRARCWAHRIRLPRWLPKPGARAPREYGDTMLTFAGYGGRISLDRLCRCLGIPSPKADGTTGSDVLELWRSGQHDALARYNAADVEATRACWLVLTGHDVEAAA